MNLGCTVSIPMHIQGLRVFSHPLLKAEPVLKLRASVPVSDEFRAEMDAWLLERFGTREVVYRIGGELFASPGVISNLRAMLP